MALLGKSANVQVRLNGKDLQPPVDWFDIGVKASFEDNVQANITTDSLDFVLDAYTEIKNWIEKGKTNRVGIYEGMPFAISAISTEGQMSVFDGFVDLQDALQIDDVRGVIKANIKKYGLNSLADQLEPLDFGYLLELGVITSSDYVDVDYVVIKIDAAFEILTMSVMVFLLSKQFAESVFLIADAVATISGIAVSGFTGPAGAAVYAAANAIINAIYAAALLAVIVELGQELIRAFVQPKRTHKAIRLKTMLEKTAQYLGYGFNTSIQDLDYITYLPSNIAVDEFDDNSGFLKKAQTITKGVPNVTDYGYRCTEAFELARTLFNARYQLVDGVIQLHSENADYWIRNSSFMFPDVLESPYKYNTDELNSSMFIRFNTDLVDEYTIENFTGTNYQVLTDAITVQDPRRKTIKGLSEVIIPLALGNRKDSLNGFEKTLASLAGLFDKAANIFGGNSNLKGKVTSKVGVLKVTNNNHSVPKLLWMQGGRIPQNHRNLFSAKTLWENYHSYNSFVMNNFKRQRKVYEGVQIPFGFADFIKLINNSYFRTRDSRTGKVTDIEWNMSKDTATVSYWIEEVYTKNLKETYIEP